MEYPLQHNKANKRFEIMLDGGNNAFISYEITDEGHYLLHHTEVPKEHEGKGIAAMLAQNTFKAIKEEGKKIIASCSYLKHYLSKHSEWKEIMG